MIGGHVPVMVESALRLLAPRPGARIVDATVGAGGHAEAILHRLGSDGNLIGMDRDPEMLALAETRLRPCPGSFRLVHARLSSLRQVVDDSGLEPVDGVLLDLGLCSAQLDDRERGFSFRPGSEPSPLDMRMDRRQGRSAAELLEQLDDEALAEVLRAGGVPYARRVTRALRAHMPIRTTRELVDALADTPLPRRRHHPATLVFQALRMATNEEAQELESGLDASVEVLAPRGRLAVLSYHSGEDRRVKQFLTREERGCVCPPRLPRCACGRSPRLRVLVRGERPSPEEIRDNPRARSARLRGAERW